MVLHLNIESKLKQSTSLEIKYSLKITVNTCAFELFLIVNPILYVCLLPCVLGGSDSFLLQ